ncbi:phosphotransferase enzyme family protein [Alicyclobacillus herbarius]|uniref:phosphotransferase enzyme family protein n=1 Tax=Alicyclobacillus herbarius TaxID=122960 RepID=UPI00040D1DB8|nr:phosphotransferase [Alicyclobacillus herbarius]
MKTVVGVIDTSGRRYIWKPVGQRDDEARLAELVWLAARLRLHGLALAAPLPTRDGRMILRLDGTSGYLQPWLPGRHVCLADATERFLALVTLANLHRLSRPWLPYLRVHGRAARFAQRLQGKLRTLQRTWPEAEAGCPGLGRSRSWVFAMATACDVESLYPGACSEVAFCHRDAAPHNLIWLKPMGAHRQTQAGDASMSDFSYPVGFIDFDHADIDDPFLDVMQLFNHTVYFAPPNPTEVSALMASYREVAYLTEIQEERCWRVLLFPDVLVRTLAEWCSQGCPKSGRLRIWAALHKERQRLLAWRRDYSERFGRVRADRLLPPGPF